MKKQNKSKRRLFMLLGFIPFLATGCIQYAATSIAGAELANPIFLPIWFLVLFAAFQNPTIMKFLLIVLGILFFLPMIATASLFASPLLWVVIIVFVIFMMSRKKGR